MIEHCAGGLVEEDMNESKIEGNRWFEFWCGSYRVGTWGKTRQKALANCSLHKIQPLPISFTDKMKVATSTIVVI